MKRICIIFTASREGSEGESFLVMENSVPPHKLCWGNTSNQRRIATLQHMESSKRDRCLEN